jgi:hypothetical protein
MKPCVFWILCILCIVCCKHVDKGTAIKASQSSRAKSKSSLPTTKTFTKYTIPRGAHECEQRTIKVVSGTSMNFIVKFDSTAIYPAVITDYNHAHDINKLWGFSEGWNNHYNSARIGWRWLNGQLQLFAYVYVKGKLLRDPVSYDPPFIKSVAIGAEINCSISISSNSYIFTVDGVVLKTERGRSTSKYNGYQQFPYFGGQLSAPHMVSIYIQ